MSVLRLFDDFTDSVHMNNAVLIIFKINKKFLL